MKARQRHLRDMRKRAAIRYRSRNRRRSLPLAGPLYDTLYLMARLMDPDFMNPLARILRRTIMRP